MRIINPVSVSSSDIEAINIPVTESQWDASTTYSAEDAVITTVYGEMIYVSVADGNIGNNPETDNGTNWQATVPSNTFAMFDNKVGTVSSNPSSIDVELAITKPTNSVALVNISGQEVRIEAWDYDGITKIYDETYGLRDYGTSNMYDFYFSDWSNVDRVVEIGLPLLLSGAKIKVTLSANNGGDASIGAFIYGKITTIGKTQYDGFSVGINDYSTKEVDAFGNYTIVERPFQNLMDALVTVDNVNVANVKKILSSLRATPILWVADPNKAESIVFGFFEDFSIALPTPAYSECSLTINGVT